LGRLTILSEAPALQAADSQQPREEPIEQLIRQLGADTVALRDQAEQALLESASAGDAAASEAYLRKLSSSHDRMPEEVRSRLARVADRIAAQLAHRTVAPTRITLKAEQLDLDQLLSQIDQLTGNRLVDYRESFGQDHGPRRVTVAVADQPFWPALDQILDAARLDLYLFSGATALAVIDREPGTLPRQANSRTNRVCYADSFRIEAVKVVAQRNLRRPRQNGLRVTLEIAWEPRLRPISLSQPAAMLSVVDKNGAPLAVASPSVSLDVEVSSGSHATELTVPLVLPQRPVESIARFSGQLTAMVPGNLVEFRFDHLTGGKQSPKAPSRDRRQGGVTVTLDRVRRNQDLWEIHMRLRLDGPTDALQSHRSWVFQNLTYLQDGQGGVVDHAGFETVLQTEQEIGLVYYFDLPNAIDNYTWIYRTPAAIVRMPVKYELRDIPLP
jgi:hypothetical protein